MAGWFDLPDGVALRGLVSDGPAGPLQYAVEVDARWRTRRAEVADGTGRRVLTTDGAGTWWLGGEPAEHLAGCLDVDVEATPVTNTLPIRRNGAGAVMAAWVRVPGPVVEQLEQSYEHDDGDGRWTYRSNPVASSRR